MINRLKKYFTPFKLPQDYKELVYKVATGDRESTSAALRQHRKLLATPEYKETIEYGFMHEMDNPCPDLLLRIHYRKLLIKIKPENRAI